jgi:hypothetical protein
MLFRLHNFFLLIAACLLLVIGTSVAMVKHEKNRRSISNSSAQKNLVIQFQRFGCYGDCPAYKLTIYGDGRTEYAGSDFVKQTGKAQGQIESEKMATLLAAFDKANFWTIDQYTEKTCACTLCTDMPSATTEISDGNRSHLVEHYYGCQCAPKALWELERTIDKIANTEQWTGDVSKSGPRGTTCFNPKQSP